MNFSLDDHKICSNGALKNWNEAKKKCNQLSGELLLYKDDPGSIISCRSKQDGVWVGLRKTAAVTNAYSKYCT